MICFTNIHAGQSAEGQVDLFVVPEYSSYLNPDSLKLNVIAKDNGTLFNTLGLEIKFPVNKLKISSLNYEDGFCEIVAEEKIDNEAGILKISCGQTEPILATTTNILQINFDKIDSGWAQISTNSSIILASDGLGTNVNGRTEDHNFYIYK